MTAKQFFTHPATVTIIVILVIAAIMYATKNNNSSSRALAGCKTNADCPKPGTHCGEEGICVYDTSINRDMFVPYNNTVIVRPTTTGNPPPRPAVMQG